MDDEDDRRLLDILGDVDALNDYLHGSNSKSIEEDDVTNAAYGSDGSFFASDTAGSNSGLKDGSSSMGEFGDDSAGAGLQLSSSLSFIEDELGTGNSPGGVDLGGEDQPFDILQKSLLEADITEQTLAQEALLDSQPAPTLVQAPVPFPSQLVSGGYGGGVGVVTTATAAFPTGQFLQGVSQLPNGSAPHIQVLGSFGAGGSVMTLSSLERTPQIVLRPGAPVAAPGPTTGGQVFAPTQGQVGQVGLPFKNIPLQNIIIQRGPGGTQTLVRPIQPKPLQAGAQTVYSVGLQPTPTTMANVVNANTATPGGQYTANGSIVVQPPLEQQQAQAQTNIPPGQFLLPTSLALTPGSTIHNGPADPNSNALITSQNAVQIVAGQNFPTPQRGQLILNQGVVSGSQVGGGVTQTWTGVSCASSAPVQTSCAPGRLTLVGPATVGIGGQAQVSASPVQRLLVTQTQNCTSLSPLPGTVTQEQEYRQNSSPALKQTQLSNIHAMKTMTQDSTLNSQVSAQKRPALPPITREGMILQQLARDHAGVQTPDRCQFASINDALQRLLPYHVFQGAPPSQDEFSQVDEEFEAVATQVLKRSQAMVNKYRRLLMVEAERSSPSSEMVMIDRTFNQEERSNLTQDKRMILVDPDSFLEDFCCGMKSKLFQDPSPSQSSCSWNQSDRGSTEPPYRTDSQPGYGDPGGGGAVGAGAADRLHPPHLQENKSVLELKRSQQRYGPSSASNNSLTAANSYPPTGNPPSFTAASGGQTHYQGSHHVSSHPIQPQYPPRLTSPPHPDTDSALEAAVNSILEC
ncbi:BRD4-interacting chromatin-remodeling complex-associated protein-like isoform X2 [Seriola lalandi dorsalis]|nr:BRD4-interacting chromatin-remodeling complex-associated protein-like isoform X2 [Seriola lalandi dorsalis]XP_023287072.1 BRD4-interacting chromatin-remodeling complex-associated protein-like isoform X2 [Seriola lalandi dorsalis]XP_023287073.1 BRD4-interacting chromatin-remodeling complex-associated protein-like isoform X2 [Seriola lalandi dorsalis]